MHPLSIRHTAPDLLPRYVAPFVVQLGRDNQNDIVGHQAQEHLVASAVERFVLVTVDLSVGQMLVRNVGCAKLGSKVGRRSPCGCGVPTHIRANDTGQLDAHVVKRGSNRSSADGACIPARHAHCARSFR